MAYLLCLVTMTHEHLSLITSRREAIEQEIIFLNNRIARLKAELPDLAVAERVLMNLVEMEGKSAAMVSGSFALSGTLKPPDPIPPEPPEPIDPQGSTRKPDGIPTMPDMILTILTDEYAKGVRGLEPREMTNIISHRWYPGVTTDSVGPIAWRMFKRGQLRKDGALYLLPQASAAADLKNPAPVPARYVDSHLLPLETENE